MSASNTNRKKVWIGIFGIVMVSLLAISITLAYLQSHTEDATNTFTVGDGVEIILEHDGTLHEDFTPGLEYDLPAKVNIPDTAMDVEYIAVKIEYYVQEQGADGNLTLKKVENNTFLKEYATLQSYEASGDSMVATGAGIGTKEGTRNGWFTDDNKIFYYGVDNNGTRELTKVDKGTGITVFDKIKINDPYSHEYHIAVTNPTLDTNGINIGQVSVSEIEDRQLQTFHTVVTAYAVQGNISTKQAMDEFEWLFANSGA